jgi:hypothetical protein
MSDEAFDVDAELLAMRTLADTLRPLSQEARSRVVDWAAKSFGLPVHGLTGQSPQVGRSEMPADVTASSATSFAELTEGTDLKSNADRALLAGFWLQNFEGQESFDGRSLNKLLREHGIDVSNITNALTSLMSHNPKLAMQAGKKGKFEKLYRLTTEGRKAATALAQGVQSNG